MLYHLSFNLIWLSIDAAVDSKNDVKITPDGFTITSEPFGENKGTFN